MDCERTQAMLSEHLEAGAAGSDLAQVAAHLEGCPVCAAEAEGLKATLVLLGRLPRHEAPPELLGNVLRRIAAEENATPPRSRLLRSLRVRIPLEAAAAVLLLLLAYGLHDLRRRAPDATSGPGAVPAVPVQERAFGPASTARSGGPAGAGTGAEAAGRTPAGERSAERGIARPSTDGTRSEEASPAPRTPAPTESLEAAAPAVSGTAAPPRPAPAERLAAAQSPPPPAATPKTRRRADLPVVPASRASSLATPVGAPPRAQPSPLPERATVLAAPPSRLLRPLPYGREVTLDVPPERLGSIEARIAEAARNRGGALHAREPGRGAPAGEGSAAGPFRVHLPAAAAGAFLDDLRAIGTIPPEGLPAEVDLPAGPSPEVVAYTVRIRVR